MAIDNKYTATDRLCDLIDDKQRTGFVGSLDVCGRLTRLLVSAKSR